MSLERATWTRAIAACLLTCAVPALGIFPAADAALAGNPPQANQGWISRAAAMSMDIGQIRNLAEAGDAVAQNELGVRFANGTKGAPNDQAQALAWFTRSANAGYSGGLRNLSISYDQGYGVPVDKAMALRLIAAASRAGDAGATSIFASHYYDGNGVSRDRAMARQLYEQAAQGGNVVAQNMAGLMYDRGDGGAADPVRSAYWYRKAAEQGDANAQFRYGMALTSGVPGIPFNYPEGRRWLEKAAANGDRNAPGLLAEYNAIIRREQAANPSARAGVGQPSWSATADAMIATANRQARENCVAAAEGRSRNCTTR